MAVTPLSSTTTTPALTAPGIGSNLDINTIITKLMAVERQPLTLLDHHEASYQAQLSAYGTLKGTLATFQGAMQGLAGASKFKALTAAAGDNTIFTASAVSIATPGNYAINVGHLAVSQVLASPGIANLQSASSTGALSIRVASGALKAVTIDASNNTLSGLRDAINGANAGVTASIVNDGSAAPYKLVLTANNAGAANSIQITNGLSAGELHDTVAGLAQVRAAQDAALTVNGVTVSSASNSVTTVIPGVTLNLLKGGETTLTVARDTAAVQTAVSTFVKAYNDVNGAISTLTAYDATTRTGGVLLGDTAARNLQAQLRSAVSAALPGIDGALTALPQIGVSFQKHGSLVLDDAKLSAAIASNFSDIGGLFGAQGRSSGSLLSYISSSSSSQPGNYQVNITAAATQGAAAATSAPGVSTDIGLGNDQFSLRIDGISSGNLTLTHNNNYSAAALASALQDAINGSAAFAKAGIAATVTLSGGKLTITSQSYGQASRVSLTDGTALADLGFNGSETGSGADVAGNFILSGASIQATGAGQFLSGIANSPAADIQVQYTGTPSQAAAGERIGLNFSQGYAARLYGFATHLLESSGPFASRTAGINSSIQSISDRRATLNARLPVTEARYRAQFTALDTMISRMNTTSTFLTQQLAALRASTR